MQIAEWFDRLLVFYKKFLFCCLNFNEFFYYILKNITTKKIKTRLTNFRIVHKPDTIDHYQKTEKMHC